MQAFHNALNMTVYGLIMSYGSEYAWSTFHRVLNKSPVLNMLGLKIWQGCEYSRFTQGAEYA